MEALIILFAVLPLLLLAVLSHAFGVDSRPPISSNQRNWW